MPVSAGVHVGSREDCIYGLLYVLPMPVCAGLHVGDGDITRLHCCLCPSDTEATWPEDCVQVWAMGTVVRLPGQKTVCRCGQWGLL